MIKTTRINADLLASMQDALYDKNDLNQILYGCIPDRLSLSTRRFDAWASDWGDEVNEQLERSDCCEELHGTYDLFQWAARTVGNELSYLMGLEGNPVRVTYMEQAGTGWNSLYVFTAPFGNNGYEAMAVWADDEDAALEALDESLKEGIDWDDVELVEDYEASKEIWMSSPAYCLQAE